MTPSTKVALTVSVAGFIGVLSILCIDLEGLAAILPPDKVPPDFVFTPAIKVLALVQPTILLTIAVLVGQFLRPALGLGAPFIEAFVRRSPLPSVTPHFLAGLVGGVIGAGMILATAVLCAPHLPSGAAARIAVFQSMVPLPTRLLYGGITEEVLLRWGFMTFLVSCGWRLFQRSRPSPSPACFAGAVVVSAVGFAAGHLPVAYLVVPEPNAALVLFVLVANSAFGLVAGFLYWRRGLESAMVAHVLIHVLLAVAAHTGWYW